MQLEYCSYCVCYCRLHILRTVKVILFSLCQVGGISAKTCLFSLSSILIFLAFFFINYQANKNIQLIIFIMTFMVTLYFYCLPILALGEEFWSRIIELPVAYYICGLLMIVGVGLKVKRLVSG